MNSQYRHLKKIQRKVNKAVDEVIASDDLFVESKANGKLINPIFKLYGETIKYINQTTAIIYKLNNSDDIELAENDEIPLTDFRKKLLEKIKAEKDKDVVGNGDNL